MKEKEKIDEELEEFLEGLSSSEENSIKPEPKTYKKIKDNSELFPLHKVDKKQLSFIYKKMLNELTGFYSIAHYFFEHPVDNILHGYVSVSIIGDIIGLGHKDYEKKFVEKFNNQDKPATFHITTLELDCKEGNFEHLTSLNARSVLSAKGVKFLTILDSLVSLFEMNNSYYNIMVDSSIGLKNIILHTLVKSNRLQG